ncbi:proline racemase family protein [Allorhizocola rhizosphaerae]|uniref:proline racemase family protein n=1 Tax=Allorhizocola rhizosphaerae TaxID=1872709 RepID=UPI000E3C157E|nr:proline racemase family protein [Allorhizocola rhizosphaerae]
MRARRVIHVVDSHTEGMPTRVVTGGIGVVPGDTMASRREYFVKHLDHLRTLLMYEPHGHSAMSGAILQPPCSPEADFGVIFIEVSGCLPMCGHGTIGVATVLVETGMVEVTEPVTTVRLDTPAGLVTASVKVDGGIAKSVTITNVPSFAVRLDATLDDGLPYDLAYGGNFYAIVELSELGLSLDSPKQQLLDAGLSIMRRINETDEPVHPDDPNIRGCHHVYLAGERVGNHAKHAMAIHPGWFDRSPCGTGTSARMAQLHARGELPLHTDFINESLLGTRFIGRLIASTEAGVVPTITGRAWLTGTGQHFLDPDDPFPEGFLL